jgi:hypothetical protein
MRHVEILASGSVPWYVKTESIELYIILNSCSMVMFSKFVFVNHGSSLKLPPVVNHTSCRVLFSRFTNFDECIYPPAGVLSHLPIDLIARYQVNIT